MNVVITNEIQCNTERSELAQTEDRIYITETIIKYLYTLDIVNIEEEYLYKDTMVMKPRLQQNREDLEKMKKIAE